MNKNKTHLTISASLVFLFYFICIPNAVTLEDDGLFILSMYFNGVSHPPGYPLYTLLGYIATHIPSGNPALNAHILSAFFSALASILVFLISYHVAQDSTRKILTAYVAVAAYALSSTIWSQSIITEVYTFNILLFLIFLLLSIKLYEFYKQGSSKKSEKIAKLSVNYYFFLFGVVLGLGLSNHWPLFILGGIGIFYLLFYHLREILVHWKYLFAGIVLGLTPYIWLYLNSNNSPFISFYGPLETWRDFYDFISRKLYNDILEFRPSATAYDKIKFFIYTLKELLFQWGPLNGIFLVLGIGSLFSKSCQNRKILTALLISYFSTSFLLTNRIGYEFTSQNEIDVRPFLALAHSLGAIFFSIGVVFLITKVKHIQKISITIMLLLTLSAHAFTSNISSNYRANYIWTNIYIQNIFKIIKPNSTLFVTGDVDTGVIGYWHFVKKLRPDLTIIHDEGVILFGTRLFDPRKITIKKYNAIIKKYITQSNYPVYFIRNKTNLGVTNHWLLYEYNKNVPNTNQAMIKILDNKYLEYVYSDTLLTDSWTISHRNILRTKAVDNLLAELTPDLIDKKREKLINYIEKNYNNLNGLTYVFDHAGKFKKINLFTSKEKLKKIGWRLYKKEKDIIAKSNFLNLLAKLEFESGNIENSLKLYRQSINIWNGNKNTAHAKILKLTPPK